MGLYDRAASYGQQCIIDYFVWVATRGIHAFRCETSVDDDMLISERRERSECLDSVLIVDVKRDGLAVVKLPISI